MAKLDRSGKFTAIGQFTAKLGPLSANYFKLSKLGKEINVLARMSVRFISNGDNTKHVFIRNVHSLEIEMYTYKG